MRVKVTTTGFRELEAALADIEKKATQKGIMRRALKKAAQPMADAAQAAAPVDGGGLAASVGMSTKLSKRQAGKHRWMSRNSKAAVEMFVGAGPLSSAHNQEFGNINHSAQPFMRPAWDSEAHPTVDRLGGEMWAEIEKTAARAARQAAKG